MNLLPTSQETASLPMKRSWSSWTNCDRASGRETSFGSANSFSAIGSARGTSAMLHPGAVDGSTALALQAGTAVTAGETALNSSLFSAAQMRELTCRLRMPLVPEGKPEAIGTRPRRRNPRKFGRDSRRDGNQFSSGDGLGNHQPGSMTRGFASQRQPASGRARDRAICPAVARFNEGRVG